MGEPFFLHNNHKRIIAQRHGERGEEMEKELGNTC
jgi:hypothetical protein